MFSIGWLTFHFYGLMIGLGVLVAAWVAQKLIHKFSVWDSLILVIGLGVVGARLYHVLDYWSYYRENLGEIPALWHGGMGIFGGILGGVVGAWLVTRNKQKFLELLDAAAVGLPLGQAIGRLGNWFNQELYGLPTDLPWGIFIKPENRLLSVWEQEKFHPLFIYESLWCLIIFLLLKRMVKTIPLGKGKIFALYLGLYGLGRFFLEFLRIESWFIGGINVAQAIALGLTALGIVAIIRP